MMRPGDRGDDYEKNAQHFARRLVAARLGGTDRH